MHLVLFAVLRHALIFPSYQVRLGLNKDSVSCISRKHKEINGSVSYVTFYYPIVCSLCKKHFIFQISCLFIQRVSLFPCGCKCRNMKNNTDVWILFFFSNCLYIYTFFDTHLQYEMLPSSFVTKCLISWSKKGQILFKKSVDRSQFKRYIAYIVFLFTQIPRKKLLV